MIIRHDTQGVLAESVIELEAHFLGFDPAANTYRSEGKAPLVLFDKKQWTVTENFAAPKLMKQVEMRVESEKKA